MTIAPAPQPTPPARRRLTTEERREQILAAATEVFGAVGTTATTDAIARAAGISQAYVVRTFGTKDNLLLEVANRAKERVAAAFRAEIARFTGDETVQQKVDAMGLAYKRLMADRGLLLSLRHVYALGHDPVVGPAAREGFLSVYQLIREEAGLSADDAMRFMAHGMLIDTLFAMRLTESTDPGAQELSCCALEVDQAELDQLRGLVGSAAEFSARR